LVHIFKYRTARKWIMERDVHTHTGCLPYGAPRTEVLKGCPRRYRLSKLQRCHDQGNEKTGILCLCVRVCLQVHVNVFPIVCTLLCYIMIHGSTVIT
jgi:hypothetical protein